MRLADQLRTTTFLLTLRYMVLFFVSVTILVGLFNWAAVGFIEQEADAAIDAEIKGLQEQYALGGANQLIRTVNARLRAFPDGDAIYLITDETGRRRVGNLDLWPALRLVEDNRVTFEHVEQDGSTVQVRAQIFAPSKTLRIIIGRKVHALDQLSQLAERALFWVLGITLALALLGGLLMSENVLRRVGEFNATSRRIMAGDLSQRMASAGTGDEFDKLAHNLNTMMDRIEGLMTGMQHISDNVAHDLRTPLTRLRNRLEQLAAEATAEQKDEIGACIEDADALLATFASLLSIARIEAGTYESNRDPVDIGRCLHDATELYEAVAEEKSITLDCDAPFDILVNGDRNLLFQAIANLLDNAVKYTPPGGQVGASAEIRDGQAVVTITDNGSGIPADMREKVMQRFFRLDASRSQPGAGLGLSLVGAIAQQHAIELRFEDNEPGLRVLMIFPQRVAARDTQSAAAGATAQAS